MTRARARSGRPGIRVTVVGGHSRLTRGLAAWLSRTAPKATRGAVTVAFVSDARIRLLNRTFRKHDTVTDVLSFPSGQLEIGQQPETDSSGPFLGDIVIATGRAARQAREQGHPQATELRILALHGLLHVLGYDHETDQGEMRAIEERLRRRGRVPSGLIARTRRAARR